jgi:predicted Fe-Mo cluster-binding NifX family protein
MSSRRIGITSQNRRTVTGHAGRCRRFWVYDVKDGQVLERRLRSCAASMYWSARKCVMA